MQPASLQCKENVILRPLDPANANELFQLINENRTRLRRWLPWLDRNTTAADSSKFIEFARAESAQGVGYVFGIWVNNELAGVASLQSVNKANRSANIGYWVGQKFSGQSLARLATSSLVQYAFETLGMNRIEIRCATENFSSQRVPEALGFRLEGFSRQCEFLYDHYVDHNVYSRLRSDS